MIPSHNYALAASILLKTIDINTKTIKWWAILDSGATSYFLTTDAPATNILPTAVPIDARLPYGECVCSTHVHSQHPIIAPRCLHSSYHFQPCLALTPVHRDNVQCRMHHHLHIDWVHNCVLRPNHSMRSQVHMEGTMDDPSNSM